MANQEQRKPVTLHEVEEEMKKRVSFIDNEFTDGFNLIKHQPKSVTFFGSARFTEDNEYYKLARSIAGKLAKNSYTVITGGGPGIMEAANRGAFESHGRSIGLNIELPRGQSSNPYVTQEMSFYYFFTRKVMLSFSAEAYLFFPGGFGTMDEFFEILNLVQSEKIEKVPLILVGSAYWNHFQSLFQEILSKEFKTVSPEDLKLYRIIDDEDEIVEIIKKVPIRNGIRLQFPDQKI